MFFTYDTIIIKLSHIIYNNCLFINNIKLNNIKLNNIKLNKTKINIINYFNNIYFNNIYFIEDDNNKQYGIIIYNNIDNYKLYMY
jgi:hypothetical protein